MNIHKKKYMIYTIGYSCFSIDAFVNILKKHQINAVVDVRSVPYSQFKPIFNRETLINYLKKENIIYVFLGDNCGARIDAPECYINGKADYKLISKHSKFQKGIIRLRDGIQKYQIALMCAEKDPISCHRTILICRNLRLNDIQILHLLCNGTIEDHKVTEKRLMKLYNLDQPNLFLTEAQRLEEAYNLQGEKIAYSEKKDIQNCQLYGVKENVKH